MLINGKRQLSTVQVIESIEPIEGSDFLEKAKVNGWYCAVRKNKFHTGQTVVFIEPDSLLPEENPNWDFLAKNGIKKMNLENIDGSLTPIQGYLLKPTKMCGQPSQGLVLDMDCLPQPKDIFFQYQIGQEVSSILGINLYEKPMPVEMAKYALGHIPNWLPSTSIERLQNATRMLEKYSHIKWIGTQKQDGTACSISNFDGIVQVFQRKYELRRNKNSMYWNPVFEYDLDNNLPKGFIIQGEIFGAGVDGNKLKSKIRKFQVYNVHNLNLQKNLPYHEAVELIKSINENIEYVPLVPEVDEFNSLPSADVLFKLAEKYGEGIVFQPKNGEIYDRELSGLIKFKAINPYW